MGCVRFTASCKMAFILAAKIFDLGWYGAISSDDEGLRCGRGKRVSEEQVIVLCISSFFLVEEIEEALELLLGLLGRLGGAGELLL